MPDHHPPAPAAGGSPTTTAGFDGTDPRYRAILWLVIAINGAMFLVETVAGKLAGSQALQADALRRSARQGRQPAPDGSLGVRLNGVAGLRARPA
jgi:hypothetical protein